MQSDILKRSKYKSLETSDQLASMRYRIMMEKRNLEDAIEMKDTSGIEKFKKRYEDIKKEYE